MISTFFKQQVWNELYINKAETEILENANLIGDLWQKASKCLSEMREAETNFIRIKSCI